MNFQLPCQIRDCMPQQLATVLERIDEAFFALDGTWRFTYVNARAAALLRQPARQLLGREIWSAFPEAVDSVFEREYRRAMAEQVPVGFEAWYAPLDLWLEVRAYPGPDGLSVHFRDIAAQRQAQARVRESEERFRALSASSPVGIFQCDPQGRITYVNPRGQEIWGAPEAELLEDGWLARVHPEDRAALLEGWHAALAACAEHETDYRLLLPEGGIRHVRAHSAPLRALSGSASGAVGTVWDITEHHRMQSALAENEHSLRLALNAGRMVAWEHDLETGIVQERGGQGFVPGMPDPQPGERHQGRLLRYADFLANLHPQDRERLERASRRTCAGSGDFDEEVRVLCPEVGPRWLQVMGRAVFGRHGAERLVGISLDITERKALEAELVRQAYHDALTSLENRPRFRDRVERALAVQAADAAFRPPAVLFVDLDDFKIINDSLGHEAGDRLLVLVAQRLRHETRATDTVARLGGDEFAVLLEGVHGMEEAAMVAERIVAALARPFRLDERQIHAGASVGIALARPGDTPEDLLRNADLAMYRAKHGGKGRHEAFAPEMHAAALERLTLVDELHRAVEARELALHFQPIVELGSGQPVGAEALLRWRHPVRGPISPGAFIPLAEESGLILALGRWVLAEACRTAVSWPRIVPQRALRVTVNVSARQLQEPAFVAEVREVLEDSGLPPDALVLEITESVLMRDREAMLGRLQALKALGVQIAVDDFGTGFSSLAYLQRFPVDILKLDKSFVDPLAEDGRARAVARTIIGLADALGLRSIAEGVEHEAQAAQLRALGCCGAQGYLFARPMPPETLEELFVQQAAAAAAAAAG